MLTAADTQARLRHEIAERQRRRQLIGIAQVVRGDLIAHDVERAVIAGQVMQQLQHEPAACPGIVRDVQPQQGGLSNVDAETPRMEAGAQLLGHVASGWIKVEFFNDQRRVAPHHLHGLGQPFPHHRRAENVVAVHHGLQRLHVAIEPMAAVDAACVTSR